MAGGHRVRQVPGPGLLRVRAGRWGQPSRAAAGGSRQAEAGGVLSLIQREIPRGSWRSHPLSVEFSRQEYWSAWPFPSPGDFPDPGVEPKSPEGRFFMI